jgi:site-specific recombinase XerD
MTTVLVPATAGEMLTSAERLRVDPLSASRPQLDLFVRWMQETRQLKPATVSRRTSAVAGFYRTCVIDGLLEHSPAEHLRRPRVPPESPTLGLTHLQFEALLTAARDSANANDFALVAMLGLLGPRVFEACGLAVDGRPVGPVLRTRRGSRMDRDAATRRLAEASGMRMPRLHPHMLRRTFVTTMLDAGVDLRDVQIAARNADPRTTMRYGRTRKNLDRQCWWSSPTATPTETSTASTPGPPSASTCESMRKDQTMANTIDPTLAEKLRRESEQTKDDSYPDGARGSRPNRSKVYSVRLSADEEDQIQRVAQSQHLPPSTLVRSWILERLDRERSA